MPGRGTYGWTALSAGDERRLKSANVFSDSSVSHDSSSFGDEPVTRKRTQPTRKAQTQKARQNASSRNALTDVSNIPEKNAPKGRKAKPKPCLPVQNIPNFDSFDDYKLVVQPITPIKTHVSQSTTSHSYNWDHYPVPSESAQLSVAHLSPVTSSPRVFSREPNQSQHFQSPTSHSVSNSHSGIVTRSMSNQLTDPLLPDIRTKRQRKLQHVLNDSYCVETSTPDQVGRKRTRLQDPVASPVLQPEDDLIMSMEQMSLNNSLHESLHESLRASPSKLASVVESPASHVPSRSRVLQVQVTKLDLVDRSSSSWRSPLSRNESNSQSLSLFSDLTEDSNYTTCSSKMASTSIATGLISQLEDLDEEEEVDIQSEEEDDIERLDEVESDSTESQHNSSSEVDAVFEQSQCQNEVEQPLHLVSPTLSDLAESRRNRLLSRECGQVASLDWYDFMDSQALSSMTKIGEGVYGEVYKYDDNDACKIIKVMPFGGDCTVNDEPQRKTKEVRDEVKISRLLSNLGCNFIKANRFSVVRGAYPEELLQLWDDFSEDQQSDNDRPDYFAVDQRYIVFDFSHGGVALENYQVGWSLAVAEVHCEFEHRDLHWGNILVATTSDPSITYQFTGMPELYEVKCEGIKANIIDFTLSRLKAERDEVLYSDLSEDETLFQGYGDYQFDIYRQMKDVTKNEWRGFYAVTNVFWIRYLVEKLIKAKAIPSQRGISPSPAQFKRMLIDFRQRTESYYSTVQMIYTDNLFKSYVTVHNEDSD